MKKALTICFAALALSALLCTTAFADDPENPGIYDVQKVVENVDYKLYTAGSKEAITGATAEIGKTLYTDGYYENAEILELTYTVDNPADYYLILVTSDEKKIDSDTITYINQLNGKTEIVFTVYPSKLAEVNYVDIASSGGSGRERILTFRYTPGTPKYILGDTNGDGTIRPNDALWALQFYNDNRELTETQRLAADVTGDNAVKPNDALWILQAYNGNRELSAK